MSLTECLALVDKKWAKEFVSFVESGDASDEFFAFLDSNADCQRAVDMVLRNESQGLERVAQFLRSEASPGRTESPAVELKSA